MPGTAGRTFSVIPALILSVHGSRSANSICSLASCLRRSLILGVARGGIRSLGNGVLIGNLSEAEEDLGGIFVDERGRSERIIFFNAACLSLVRCGKINISLLVGSSDWDTTESAVIHVAPGDTVVLTVGAFDLTSEATCERR